MLDQGLAKKTQAKGHLCKPSRDEDSRKPRALLCKPSRDKDSRKPRAFMQNRADIHGKPNIELVRYGSRKQEEKGKMRGNGQETENGYT